MDTHAEQEEIARLKSRMLKKSYFVMFRNVTDRRKLPGAMLAHYRWIIALEKAGKVFASGPLFQADGSPGVGMTVFRVDTLEEATALAVADPFCSSGAAGFEINRWQVNEGRICITVDLSDQTYQLL